MPVRLPMSIQAIGFSKETAANKPGGTPRPFLFLANSKQHLPYLICCLLYALSTGILSLSCDFPINDDWSYIWSIKSLCSGKLYLLASSTTALVPIYAGCLLSLLGGFSYIKLHLLTLVFSLLTATGVYKILTQLGSSSPVSAALAAGLFLFNPLIANLSLCYMTDIPSFAFSTWFFYFCLRGIAGQQKRDWLLAGSMLFLAIACRQSTLTLVPALFILSCQLLLAKRSKDWYLPGVCGAAAIVFYIFLDKIIQEHSVYHQAFAGYKEMLYAQLLAAINSPIKEITHCLSGLGKLHSYLGLFLIPLLLPIACGCLIHLSNKNSAARKQVIFASFLFAILVSTPFFLDLCVHQLTMPFSRNLFSPPAVGTYCLIGAGPSWSNESLTKLTNVCLILSPLSIFAFCCAFLTSFKNSQKGNRTFLQFVFVTALSTTALIILQLDVHNLDRYFLSLLVPGIILCFPVKEYFSFSRNNWISAILLSGLFVYSTLATLDFVNFSNCKWQLIKALEERGIASQEIDGGPEHCTLSNPALLGQYRKSKEQDGWSGERRGVEPFNAMRWWPLTREHYIVSGSKLESCNLLEKKQYFSPIKMRKQNLFAFELQTAKLFSKDTTPNPRK